MRRMTLAAGVALAASAVTLIGAPVSGATTYNNDTPITIPTQGTANPYPSSITVSGTAGPITDVNVGFDGFTHVVASDVAVALVAPSGQALLVQACVGGANAAAGAFLTFDDAAATHLPENASPTTGTFKPTAYCNTPFFPEPGPLSYANPGPGQGGTATFASAFNGLSSIGTWNLFVLDRNDGAAGGSIPGGWSLDVKPDVTPLPTANPTPTVTPTPTPMPTPVPTKKKCKKKKKKKSGGKAGAAAKKKGCKKPKKRSS